MHTVDDAFTFFVVALMNREREKKSEKQKNRTERKSNFSQYTSDYRQQLKLTFKLNDKKEELNQIKQEHCIRFHCNNDNKIQANKERDTPKMRDKEE